MDTNPGFPDALPVAIYGDEAKVSDHSGDKLIALVLQSPLVRKKGSLCGKKTAFVQLHLDKV